MTHHYTRRDLMWIAASSVVTLAFAWAFAGSGFGLRAAWPFWASLSCTGVFVSIPFLRSRAQPRDRVSVDEHGIERQAAGGTREAIRWDQLDRVFIATTDDGPANDDVFWVFIDESGGSGCAVPASAEGFEALLRRVQQLPGFDEDKALQAMGASGSARIDVWQRQPAGP